MEKFIENIIENTVRNYNKRKIVIWGAYATADEIEKEFKKIDINIAFKIDSNKYKINEKDVWGKECINNKSDEYYIIIPIGYYDSVIDTLREYGYTPDKDYYYFHAHGVIEAEEYFEDLCGNKIFGKREKVGILFNGYGASVTIKEGFQVNDIVTFEVGDNTQVEIGRDFRAWGGINFKIGKNSKFHIGDSFRFGSGSKDFKAYGSNNLSVGDNSSFYIEDYFVLENDSSFSLENKCEVYIGKNFYASEGFRLFVLNNAKVSIGDSFSIGPRGCIIVPDFSRVLIGNDCMFSFYVNVVGNDGHTIFNVNNKEPINAIRGRQIIIGNHVWIGINSTILYNSEIGEGSIIGAQSVVKNKIPNNCIAIGSPAKVIRKDVAWSRKDMAEDISECGIGNIEFTKSLQD